MMLNISPTDQNSVWALLTVLADPKKSKQVLSELKESSEQAAADLIAAQEERKQAEQARDDASKLLYEQKTLAEDVSQREATLAEREERATAKDTLITSRYEDLERRENDFTALVTEQTPGITERKKQLELAEARVAQKEKELDELLAETAAERSNLEHRLNLLKQVADAA